MTTNNQNLEYGIQLVWFKRDLRTHDHPPLFTASQAGRVLPLYVWENELWQQEDADAQHAAFIQECLADLNQQLSSLGCPLIQTNGDMVEVLAHLHQQLRIEAIYSHEETGNLWSYARDKRVQEWCLTHAIPWYEWRQDGVMRRLNDRNLWASHWETFFAKPPISAPPQIQPADINLSIPPVDWASLSWQGEDKPLRQKGGTTRAMKLLDSFLHQRGLSYRYALSSPNSAPKHCSRLSVHLAYGCVSMRQTLHSLWKAKATWKAESQLHPDPSAWLKSLNAFESRLHWHCHFMQKLETQPNIETHNLHPALNELERPLNPIYYEAFCEGKTGYPFVDACIHRLLATGWINFRMRAMLVSFACNLLWLPWQPIAKFLARQFTDYEPGIHYPQVQMQAGTTGMNILRVYNPIKQSQDQDPNGHFIRSWLPILAKLPKEVIHTPWLAETTLEESFGIRIGIDYPYPIVEYTQAARDAKTRIYDLRKHDENRRITRELLNKHGSRQVKSNRRKAKQVIENTQLSLEF